MNPYPQSRSVLLVDNCPTHFDPILVRYCIEHHILLLPLPPYCPFLQPIEVAFSTIKGKCKRYKTWMNQSQNTIDGLPQFANEITAEESINIFKHCGWCHVLNTCRVYPLNQSRANWLIQRRITHALSHTCGLSI
jgi:hypothetical protein